MQAQQFSLYRYSESGNLEGALCPVHSFLRPPKGFPPGVTDITQPGVLTTQRPALKQGLIASPRTTF